MERSFSFEGLALASGTAAGGGGEALATAFGTREPGGWGPWTRAKPAATRVLAGGGEACGGTARDPGEAGSRVRSPVGTEPNAGVGPSGPAGSLRRGFRSKGRDRHVAATRPAEVAATV